MCPLAGWVKEIAALATAETCAMSLHDFGRELFAKERRNSLKGENWARNICGYIVFLKYFEESFSMRKEGTVELFSCFAVFQGQKNLQRGSPIFVLWYYERVQ